MSATVNSDREPPERQLTVAQAAEVLGTTERFPRRLIEERRIRFTRIGRHVAYPNLPWLNTSKPGPSSR